VATGDPGITEPPAGKKRASSPLPTAVPTAAPIPTRPAAEEAAPAVSFGDFVPPEQVDNRPVVIKSQALEWPRNAARSKRKGLVIVELTVNASGGVEDVAILRADHTGWGIPEAAQEAAAGYRFKPGTKDGVAVTTKAFVTWRYDFTAE
jgi:TonB family protein